MGCDIHAHLEVKVDDKWEHHSSIDIDRNYYLFGLLVDGHLRGQCKGVAQARGMPTDANPLTNKCIGDKRHYHTHSYLLPKELNKAILKYEKEHGYELDSLLSLKGVLDYTPLEHSEYRLVFAFDS